MGGTDDGIRVSTRSDIARVSPQALSERDTQRECIEQIDQNFMRLGQSCLLTKENRWYLQFGYATMEEYVSCELANKPSTIRYFMQLAKYRRELGNSVPDKDWAELGPTKSRILAMANPERKNVPALVEKYKDPMIPTRAMHSDLLGDNLEGIDRPKKVQRDKVSDRVSLRLSFTLEQWSTIESAIEQARKEAGDPEMSESLVFEFIAGDYLAGPASPIERISICLKQMGLDEDTASIVLTTIESMVTSR